MNLCQCFFNLTFKRLGNTHITNKDRIILNTIQIIVSAYRSYKRVLSRVGFMVAPLTMV